MDQQAATRGNEGQAAVDVALRSGGIKMTATHDKFRRTRRQPKLNIDGMPLQSRFLWVEQTAASGTAGRYAAFTPKHLDDDEFGARSLPGFGLWAAQRQSEAEAMTRLLLDLPS